MSLLSSFQYLDYPAYWVQIRLSPGNHDTGFWIIGPNVNVAGQMGEGISPPSGVTFDPNSGSLPAGLPSPSGPPDTARFPSLLEAIKTWAAGYAWGGGWTVQSVTCMQVNEAYTDKSPP